MTVAVVSFIIRGSDEVAKYLSSINPIVESFYIFCDSLDGDFITVFVAAGLSIFWHLFSALGYNLHKQ